MLSRHVTPDAGYAWAILAAGAGAGILHSDFYSTSGVFYVEYTERVPGVSKATAAWISGLKLIMMSVGSVLHAALLPQLGVRPLVLLCTAFTVVGYMVTMFITNVYLVILFYGVLPGLGLCTSAVLWMQIIATFFVRRRGFAFGLMVGSNAAGSAVLPILLQYLFSEYSWKGALLINGGLHLHMLLVALIVPRDFGRCPPPPISREVPAGPTDPGSDVVCRVRADSFSGSGVLERPGSVEFLGPGAHAGDKYVEKYGSNATLPDIPEKAPGAVSPLDSSFKRRRGAGVAMSGGEERSRQRTYSEPVVASSVCYPATTDTDRSLHQLPTGDHRHAEVVITDDVPPPDASLRSLLRQRKLLVFLLATLCTGYGHITTFAFVPSRAREAGLSLGQASAMVSVMAAVNIVGRPVMGWLSDLGPCVPRRGLVYAVSWAAYGALLAALAFAGTFQLFLVVILAIGVVTSFAVAVGPSVLVDLSGPRAVSLFPPAISVGMLSGSVAGGLILEVTGSCTVVMLVAGATLLVASAILLVNHLL